MLKEKTFEKPQETLQLHTLSYQEKDAQGVHQKYIKKREGVKSVRRGGSLGKRRVFKSFLKVERDAPALTEFGLEFPIGELQPRTV